MNILASNNIGICIRSQVVLNRNEFTLYNIGQENNITLCFKPFRAAVAFAETFHLPIMTHFDSGGKYVIVKFALILLILHYLFFSFQDQLFYA